MKGMIAFSGTSKVHWWVTAKGQTLCQTPAPKGRNWAAIAGDAIEVECKRCAHLLGDAAKKPVRAPGSMTPEQALETATIAHRFQKDKNGHPYIEHLLAVQKGVQVLGVDPNEEIAALLHDIVEDQPWSIADLRAAGCPEPSLVMIEAVTKRSGEEQNAYLARIIKAGHGACRVKLADVLNNTRHDRMAALPDYKRERLQLKYRPVLAALMLELGLLVNVTGQNELATKPKGSSSSWSGGYGGGTGTGSSNSWPVGDVLVGEWPMKFKAPVIGTARVGKGRVLVLADHSVVTLTEAECKESQYLRPFSQWTAVNTEERKTFKAVVEDAKEDPRVALSILKEWKQEQFASAS